MWPFNKKSIEWLKSEGLIPDKDRIDQKYSYNEQCDIWISDVFEGVYSISDGPNRDKHYHVIYDDGSYYIFENKSGRAQYSVYRTESGVIEYNDILDRCSFSDREDRWEGVDHIFDIRLKNVEFIKDFLENLLGRDFEFKRSYKRELKINQLLKK